MTTILAGNIVRSIRTFTALSGEVVNPSDVEVTVTDRFGNTTPLTSTVEYNADDTALTVTANWAIADDAGTGWWTLTHDVSGTMVAAYQEAILVQARIDP